MVAENRNQTEQTSSAASFDYCSDFGNESNGILRSGFLTEIFNGNFLYYSKGIVVPSLNFKINFTCDHFAVNL